MDFADAARYFFDDPVYDSYSGAYLYSSHTSPHDDHTSSGSTARRRTMTTIVNTTPPARYVVQVLGADWIVGNSNLDGFQGIPVRRSYGLKKSTGLLRLLTPAAACLNSSGTAFHAHKEYYKDLTNTLTDAEIDVQWNIFCPRNESVAKGSFFFDGASFFRVRSVYFSVDEYIVAETDQLDADASQAAVFTTTGALDILTDTTATSSVATTVVQTDVPKYFKFRTVAEADRKPGDRTVFVAKSVVTPAVGTTLTMLGATWRVLAVVSEGDAWALHCRLA
jgi:hypothetical protein